MGPDDEVNIQFAAKVQYHIVAEKVRTSSHAWFPSIDCWFRVCPKMGRKTGISIVLSK
jgi:hypothetical protein